MVSTHSKPTSLARARKIRSQIRRLQTELEELGAGIAPEVILPQLHDPRNGRIDAQKVADFIGIPLKPLSEGLGLNYKAVHRNSSASGFQPALQPVKRALEILQELFGSKETIRIWLNTPHPELGGDTSLNTILSARTMAVTRLLENARQGVPL